MKPIFNDTPNCTTGSNEFNPNSENISCRKLVKNILSHKIFIGEYVERRYVEPLQEYRDVIFCEKNESDLIRFIKEIKKNIEYGNKKWLGITEDLRGYYLWVKLEKLPFGKHWFQMRSLKIQEKEVYLKLKYLRPFRTEEKEINVQEIMPFNFKEVCTFANFCEASRFSMILILTIVTFIVKSGAFFLDFLLRMTREISFLIDSFTPIIVALINAVAKCIGGFYWLILMLSRGNSVPPPRVIQNIENRFTIMGSSKHIPPSYLRRNMIPLDYKIQNKKD